MKPIEQTRILVIGDIMLDKYVVGNAERISPEAPVPIVHVTDEYHTLGGCGNVVRNIAELGAVVDCMASIGKDNDGITIESELTDIGARPIMIQGSKITIVKERVIADHRKIQMLRVDRECVKEIDAINTIKAFQVQCRHPYDMIIISDYEKGMITKDLMEFLKREQNAPIIVDPKPGHAEMYDNVFMITPNEKEWRKMLFASPYTLKHVHYILQTKGCEGMVLLDNLVNENWYIQAEDVPVYNVSGAGDVVVAMMAVCLSHGLNVLDSVYIANKCAGYAVTQPQTCVIPQDKFMEIYEDYFRGNV